MENFSVKFLLCIAIFYNFTSCDAFKHYCRLQTILIACFEAINFSDLPKLRTLNLKGNRLTNLTANSLGSLDNLRELYLCKNHLTSLNSATFSRSKIIKYIGIFFSYMDGIFTYLKSASSKLVLKSATLFFICHYKLYAKYNFLLITALRCLNCFLVTKHF